MTIFQRQRHGFTLIELLVTTSIAMLIAGAAIAGFVTFTDRQEVLNAAKEVQQMLRTAQAKARIKDVPKSCSDQSLPLARYQVVIDGTTLRLEAFCESLPTTKTVIIQKYELPDDVSMSLSPIPAAPYTDTIQFKTLEDGTNLTNPTTLTFHGAENYLFTISPRGSISNVEPQ